MFLLALTLSHCQDFCTARFYEGGFSRKNECYCYELVEQDVPPGLTAVSGVIKEKTNQGSNKPASKIDLGGYSDE